MQHAQASLRRQRCMQRAACSGEADGDGTITDLGDLAANEGELNVCVYTLL